LDRYRILLVLRLVVFLPYDLCLLLYLNPFLHLLLFLYWSLFLYLMGFFYLAKLKPPIFLKYNYNFL
jgi:hypothetical protein